MSSGFDVIVIGSGFGGAITACRLAQKGLKVLILERGQRWEKFPRDLNDSWRFNHEYPERDNGWLDMRQLRKVVVAQGAGVGGGSLIYANVSVKPKPEIFDQGWPAEITYDELDPYLDRVGAMLNVQTVPPNQYPPHRELIHDAANALGYGDRFRPVPLAVTFNPNFSYQATDPFNDDKSIKFINPHGVEQGTCVHCGNCDLGCQVKAKNTLDLNYIPEAEKHHAEVRPLHLVKYIQPENGGYRVYYDEIKDFQRIPGSEKASKVIVAAGTLNSTEILLRSRDQYKTLPNLSRILGYNWSTNADYISASFNHPRDIYPSRGPTITSVIDLFDGAVHGESFMIEDGGIPPFLSDLAAEAGKIRWLKKFRPLLTLMGRLAESHDEFHNDMLWFAVGKDAADGQLFLGRRWYAPWQRILKLHWNISASKPVIDAIAETHRRLSKATEGSHRDPPGWTYLLNLVTAHPLGGSKIGNTAADGVVNHRGEVFGYPNLYVADGSIVPESVGLNPSRTIGALAERIVDLM
jgi:cholesterol oxidase